MPKRDKVSHSIDQSFVAIEIGTVRNDLYPFFNGDYGIAMTVHRYESIQNLLLSRVFIHYIKLYKIVPDISPVFGINQKVEEQEKEAIYNRINPLFLFAQRENHQQQYSQGQEESYITGAKNDGQHV